MDFHLPQLGEGVYEAEMVRWLVNAGDRVHHGQGLMEVMTDKATMEVPAPFSGHIDKVHAQPGTQVKVGDVVLQFTPANGASGRQHPEQSKARHGHGAKPLAAKERHDEGATPGPGDGAQTIAASPRRVAASLPDFSSLSRPTVR